MRPFVLFVAVVLFASPAYAGLFDRFRIRSTPRAVTVRVPNVQGAKTYRVECSNGTCRRVEVK